MLFGPVKFTLSAVLTVSVIEGFSVSSGLGVGETISIYLGVNTNTREMRKNAKRVFLSILSQWVFAAFKKRITPKQPNNYKIDSHKQGLLFNSFSCIVRAGWVKPAGGTYKWRNCNLVSSNENKKYTLYYLPRQAL
tara:strand:+ start:35 stop:442 length:408 start_codon:yes stop_codon:yes gene_type:complete